MTSFNFNKLLQTASVKIYEKTIQSLVKMRAELLKEQISISQKQGQTRPVPKRYSTPYMNRYSHKKIGQQNKSESSPIKSGNNRHKTTQAGTFPSSMKSTIFDAQKVLNNKKKQLLQELRTVDHELQRVQLEKSRIGKSKNHKQISHDDQSQNYSKASELVEKMNLQRREFENKRRLKAQQITMNVQKSLKQFEEMNLLKQKQKQQKRKQIENRILDRKQKVCRIENSNRISNKLVQELQQHRVSLPLISRLNPQQIESQSIEKKKNKRSSAQNYKVYPKSSFLENIEKQQLIKKKEQFLKSYERRKKLERQIQYGRKIRGVSTYKENNMFVTQVGMLS